MPYYNIPVPYPELSLARTTRRPLWGASEGKRFLLHALTTAGKLQFNAVCLHTEPSEFRGAPHNKCVLQSSSEHGPRPKRISEERLSRRRNSQRPVRGTSFVTHTYCVARRGTRDPVRPTRVALARPREDRHFRPIPEKNFTSIDKFSRNFSTRSGRVEIAEQFRRRVRDGKKNFEPHRPKGRCGTVALVLTSQKFGHRQNLTRRDEVSPKGRC